MTENNTPLSDYWLLNLCNIILLVALSFYYTIVMASINDFVHDIKSKLFATFEDLESQDPELRNKGLIRIMELGVGPGYNLKYYPQNATLITVDSNPYFRRYCHVNMRKYSRAVVEKEIVREAEDISEIADNSVDAVVTTAVLCSVRDVQAVLKEIHRILAPRGKYFFFEHILEDDKANKTHLQALLNPLWTFLFDFDHQKRNVDVMIKEAGLFSNINMEKITVPWKYMSHYVVGPHVIGTAEK